MERVFISHSSCDITRTREISEILEDNGIPCWFSERDLPAGIPFANQIVEEIEKCRCILLLISQKSQTSENVENEIKIAKDFGKKIIAVKIEEVELSGAHQYYLTTQNWVTAIDGTEEEMKRIISEIKGLKADQVCERTSQNISDGVECIVSANSNSDINKFFAEEVECPICKSKKLTSYHVIDYLRSTANGFGILSRGIMIILLPLEMVAIFAAILMKSTELGNKILQIICKFPVFGDYIYTMEDPIKGLSIAMLVIYGLMLMPNVIAYAFDTWRAKEYRKAAEKGSCIIEYFCKDCNHSFSIEHSLDELRRRNDEKWNGFDTLFAVLVTVLLLLALIIAWHGFQVLSLAAVFVLVYVVGKAAIISIKYYIAHKRTGNGTKEELIGELRKYFVKTWMSLKEIIKEKIKKKGTKNYDQPR